MDFNKVKDMFHETNVSLLEKSFSLSKYKCKFLEWNKK